VAGDGRGARCTFAGRRIPPPEVFRRRAAASVIACASLIWVAGLAALGYGQPALPWCLTLLATACGALSFSRPGANVYAPAPVLSADRQPVSFLEAYALTYMVASVALSGWIIFHLVYKPPALAVRRQVVDIQLTSLNDFQDRHEMLPGSPDKPSLRKRTSSTVTAQGDPATVPVRKPVAKPAADRPPAPGQKPAPRQEARLKPANAAQTTPVFIAQPPDPPLDAKASRQSAERKRDQDADKPFWEEVKAPELVEMVDNEGDHSLNFFQPGGRSAGGQGAHSDLADYLKYLNKRIKSLWSPPPGETRKTEILFRLRRSGALAMARIVRSSGNAAVDESAMQALVAAAPFHELPADYPHSYLDLHYSFNYNVDELSEVNDAGMH